MKRLFGCTVSLLYQDEHGEAAVNSVMARRTEFWWNERKPDQPSLWESKIELGEDLFYEIISHPVPIDMNTLTAMKRLSRWVSISTCGWPIEPSRFALRSGSPGRTCTVSSEHTPPKPATR